MKTFAGINSQKTRNPRSISNFGEKPKELLF